MFGYMGRVLRVDLTKNRILVEDLDEKFAAEYVGGVGFGTKILFNELKPGIDPLGPENKLVFSTGPVVGTGAPAASRWFVSGKSPLGILGEATGGGYFGTEMKHSGYDIIIIEGKAPAPIYLSINDRNVQIKEADFLWGLDVYQTEDYLKLDLQERWVKVACIGPAGERLVSIAGINCDRDNQASRCGLGAVMGSKNLKAIVVRGNELPRVAFPNEFEKLVWEIVEEIGKSPLLGEFEQFGTSKILDNMNMIGCLPTKNWQQGTFSGIEKIGSGAVEKFSPRKIGCYKCPVKHDRYVKFNDIDSHTISQVMAEYETGAAFGPLVMNRNRVLIEKASIECNRLGLDAISTGSSIAFAMECFEKGILDKKDFQGIGVSWGNAEAIMQLIRKIAYREGIGDILANGVKKASEIIGRGSEDFAVHIKGLEPGMYDPRGLWSQALASATANRGGCHLRQSMQYFELGLETGGGGPFHPELGITRDKYQRFSINNKAEAVMLFQDVKTMIDSLIVCNLAYRRLKQSPLIIARLYSAVTGNPVGLWDMVRCGEKIFNLARLFNIREGLSRKDDMLPKRLLEPLSDGPCKGRIVEDFERMLDEYYELRGWDRNGIPKPEKLKQLGLNSGQEREK